MPGKNVILICGDDDYLVTLSAKKRIDALVPPDQRDFGLEVIDGNVALAEEAEKAVDNCIGSVQTQSFFMGNTKVTWLRDAAFLASRKKDDGGDGSDKKAGGAAAKLADFIKKPLPGGQVLLVTAQKVSRVSSFFKTCQKIGEVEDFGSDLKPWEQDRAAEKRLDALIQEAGISLDMDAREEFLQRVGADTRTLVSELQKLSLYVGGGAKATKEDVETITSLGRETMAWDLLDAFDARDAKRTLAVLHKLEGQKGIAIILDAMLEKNVRDLIVLREAVDRGWIVNGSWARALSPETTALLNALPVNPTLTNAWKLRKMMPFVNKFTMMELRVARYQLVSMRERLVSSDLPEMYLLQTTLLRIIGKKKR